MQEYRKCRFYIKVFTERQVAEGGNLLMNKKKAKGVLWELETGG